jgi:hypothetical protein
MRKSVVLPAPLGPDDADDAAARQAEAEVVDQQPVAVALLQLLGDHHLVAEPRTVGDHDLGAAELLARVLA